MRQSLCKVKALEVMSELGVSPPPPIDIDYIVKKWGLAVEYVERPRGLHGRMLAERALVEIASGDAPNRQRFSLAHELGHYLLEHNAVYSDAEPDEITDPHSLNEREANAFAAELLMPEQWVTSDWKSVKNAGEMAALYRVSSEAMWYRLEGLRLIQI